MVAVVIEIYSKAAAQFFSSIFSDNGCKFRHAVNAFFISINILHIYQLTVKVTKKPKRL